MAPAIQEVDAPVTEGQVKNIDGATKERKKYARSVKKYLTVATPGELNAEGVLVGQPLSWNSKEYFPLKKGDFAVMEDFLNWKANWYEKKGSFLVERSKAIRQEILDMANYRDPAVKAKVQRVNRLCAQIVSIRDMMLAEGIPLPPALVAQLEAMGQAS